MTLFIHPHLSQCVAALRAGWAGVGLRCLSISAATPEGTQPARNTPKPAVRRVFP